MSDLISRESVIKELNELRRYVPFPSSKDVFDIIMKAKAIEQGEAVIDKAAYDGAREDLSIWKRRALEAEEKVRKYDQRIVDIGVIAMTPVTTPQQPQSVADALEEAAKICDGYERYYSDIAGIAEDASVQLPCLDKALMAKECSESIRALIKRNAEVME